ncbi:putative disease resistance protein [Camellia lanceoleosa]|uniref:Disease resistance protein n=1 Tax=Camellia lanceoleosa TaxID=1840588 RepID=A0ACC0G8K1_9ERIC|nr:putative disease resistance protein [Camellia lanceoleosa]
MKDLMEILRDDEINMIGICGMGGIGKTTMVKDVVNRAPNEHLFDAIVMAVVSQHPNLMNVQGQIADILDLKLEEETLPGRVAHLHQRLTTVKRILIVLDDVWERIDLQEIGIPFWSENRGCKVVLMSRSLDVGDSVEAPDLQPTAEQVVNECQEDHDIQIEDLVRFGMGLRLFEDIDRLGEARDQVHALVNILKNFSLLLDSDKDECVKMQDVVRGFAISIASKGDNVFLIRHGDSLTEWPEKHTCEPYTSISIISGKITELPEGLRYPQLTLLLLSCMNDSIKTPDNFFEGMRKLQVLNLELISIPLLPSSLQLVSNLHTICLQFCKLDNITLIGELLNLEILSFRGSSFEVLPEEIGKLANLRLLDLTGCHRLERITPCVISGLVKLEELYMIGSFSNWETDKGETTEERRNASLRELQSLSDLRILEIYIPDAKLLPRSPLFTNLTQFKIRIGDNAWWSMFPFRKHLLLKLDNNIALDGGVSKLLKCTELLSLKGKGS